MKIKEMQQPSKLIKAKDKKLPQQWKWNEKMEIMSKISNQ